MKNRKFNYANHLLDKKDHIFNGKIEILHKADKRLKLKALESMEINRGRFDMLLHEQSDLNSSPLLNFVLAFVYKIYRLLIYTLKLMLFPDKDGNRADFQK